MTRLPQSLRPSFFDRFFLKPNPGRLGYEIRLALGTQRRLWPNTLTLQEWARVMSMADRAGAIIVAPFVLRTVEQIREAFEGMAREHMLADNHLSNCVCVMTSSAHERLVWPQFVGDARVVVRDTLVRR